MRYFVFLRILERDISNLLDIAIFTLNPLEKWGAHVTLAGPYSSSKNLPRDRAYERKISVVGVGQFRSEEQNTVFLRIGASDLKDVWDKPEYPFNPHLTIYDGRDHKIGDILYKELKKIRPFLVFNVSRLEIVCSAKGEPMLPLDPPLDFQRVYNFGVTDIRQAWSLPLEKRIELAVTAIKRAKNYNLGGVAVTGVTSYGDGLLNR